MERYFLSRHAFVCFVDSHAIFLDLKRGKYSALPAREVALLRACVNGWLRGEKDTPTEPPTECNQLLSDLSARGILTTDEHSGHPAVPVSVELALRDCLDGTADATRVAKTLALAFILSWAVTITIERMWSLERIVRHVQKRKEGAQSRSASIERFLIAMAEYRKLRRPRWFRVPSGIAETLLLVEFLARRGLYPSWVFGVRLKPFSSLTWLQVGDLVLTTSTEAVQSYTPILAI